MFSSLRNFFLLVVGVAILAGLLFLMMKASGSALAPATVGTTLSPGAATTTDATSTSPQE
jgi:uncharacterized MnhB-related membrane protein